MFAQRTSIPASATATVHALVQKLKAEGKTIYDLSVGEPALPSDERLLQAAQKALLEDEQFYPPVAGFEKLRSAVSTWMNSTYASSYRAQEVLVTGGGKFGIFLTLQALVNPGDEVVIVAPHWVSYPSVVQLFDGVVKIVKTTAEQGWKLSPHELQKACSSRTRLLILNNGCNPTGALYTREELEALLAVLPAETWILSDEVYSGLVYDGKSFCSVSSLDAYRDRTVVVQSCSKNFAMTGWRLGFVLGPQSLIDILIKLQGQSITAPAALSQKVALAALENAAPIQVKIRETLELRRNLFLKGLQEIFGPCPTPPSALYLFLSLSYFGQAGEDDTAFAEKLLQTVQVAVVPGSAFGYPGYIRLAYGGTEEQLQKCLERLSLYKSQFSL